MSNYKIKVGDKIRAARESGGSTTVMTGKVTKVEASAVPGAGRYFVIEGITGVHYLYEWVVTLIEKAKPDLPDGLYVSARFQDDVPEDLVDYVVLELRDGEWSTLKKGNGTGPDVFLREVLEGKREVVRLVKEGTC